MLGPCRRAKRCAKRVGLGVDDEVDAALAVQQHVLVPVRAIALKPRRSNSSPMATGSGAAYSMNSKPSVPIGLSQAGVIAGYVALVDAERVGLALAAYISVRLAKRMAGDRHSPVESFTAAVQAWPEVVECAALSGDMDYLLHVRVADMAHYSRFIMDTLLQHPTVQDCKTSFVLQRLKTTTALPL
jgi:Lrp/AsnC family transcriptional regulator, leucine-responsive regulatory protein